MRKAKIYFQEMLAGILEEAEQGYRFTYDGAYLANKEAESVSLKIPLRSEPYESKFLFPFLDGLIPEGWLLELATNNWKINHRDRMALLLAFCRDCIGAVSVIPLDEKKRS